MVNLGHLALIHTYAKSEADTGTVNYQFQTTAWFHVQTNMAGKYQQTWWIFHSAISFMFQSGLDPQKKNVNPWQVQKNVQVYVYIYIYTLPDAKIFTPKNGWLEDEVRFGMAPVSRVFCC